jgi:tRNA threonylcarbamoyladenosine biosynthesis protein TsaE
MITQSFRCPSLQELDAVAKQITDAIANEKIVAFYGDMGAGKTTFITAICKQLGVTDNISSPTFSIVNEYETANHETIYHFDFYRLNSEEEALDLGYENYFYSGDRCFIEWPQKIENLMQLPHVKLTIVNENEERIITIEKMLQ